MRNNPLYQMFGGNQPQGGGNDILSRFNQFKQNFNGDPKAKVQELLNTGQMSQEQFNQLSQMANTFLKGGS